MVCLVEPGKEADARDWFEVGGDPARGSGENGASCGPGPGADTEPWVMRHDRDAYLDRIRRSLHEIARRRILRGLPPQRVDPELREGPARHLQGAAQHQSGALFGLPALRDAQRAELLAGAHGASSPRSGLVSCKPIKGTIARGKSDGRGRALKEQLRTSEKDQAENLMIVDLIRNDLNRVCRTGTVAVPHLCAIEIVRDRPPDGLDGGRRAAQQRDGGLLRAVALPRRAR